MLYEYKNSAVSLRKEVDNWGGAKGWVSKAPDYRKVGHSFFGKRVC